MPGVIGTLHLDPDKRRIPEQLCKPHCDFRADRLPFGQKVVQVLARYAEHPRDFDFRFAGRGDHVLAEQFARMRRAAVGVAAHPRLLVVLLVVQHIGVAVAELEGDAPRAIHMNGVARWCVPSQTVEIKARQLHVFGSRGGVERIWVIARPFLVFITLSS